jgi:transposase
MAMGKRKRESEPSFWIATSELPETPSHPFYQRLNRIFDTHDFDRLVERLCRKFYADKLGRPSLPPGVYFRLLFLGYFEGIDSERGIAWRVGDSLSLRRFLGLELTEATPDHSTISRTRRLIDQETHQAVFDWVLKVLAKEDLLVGKTLGVDATTLEANAALRSIVRRDTGQKYNEFLKDLAKASGIETPTREDLAKLDRNRPHKGSNEDWKNPYDPDAKITKMKDGRTHLAHKAEHAVDLDTGAVVAVTLQPANRGDTASLPETLDQADANLVAVMEDPEAAKELSEQVLSETVTDKGYHSNETLVDQGKREIRTYSAEPDRGCRRWEGKAEEQQAVYANRRRIRGKRGKRLMRKRGEYVERTFAHCYDTGGMRRTHLKHHDNISKRLLIHVAGFNLSLIMRRELGKGTTRGLQGLAARVWAFGMALWRALKSLADTDDRTSHREWTGRHMTLQAA